MKLIRIPLVCALALTGALALPALAADAATPTAPYNVFTVDAGLGSSLVPAGPSFVFEGSAGASLAINGSGVTFADGNWAAGIDPPTTTGEFVAGTTYQLSTFTDPDKARMQLTYVNQVCGTVSGSLEVTEATYQDVTLTAFAGTYSYVCAGQNPVVGEVRVNSTIGYTAATTSPNPLAFGDIDLGAPAVTLNVTVKSWGSDADALGAASITGDAHSTFAITGDTCSNTSLTYGQTCTIEVKASPTVAEVDTATLALPDGTVGGTRLVPLSVTGVGKDRGTYYPLRPTRILDTRIGLGAPKGPVGGEQIRDVQVTGKGGVPAAGVDSVVFNVTVTGPTASSSYLTVYPTGQPVPLASNLNYKKGWTGANGVTVRLGQGGMVTFFNREGNAQVIADVVGYYAGNDDNAVGGSYIPVVPTYRTLDTRVDPIGIMYPADTYTSWIGFSDDTEDWNPHLTAFAVNITAVGATKAGYLTVWNGLDGRPTASTLNFAPGAAVSNMAIVKTTPCSNLFPGESNCVDQQSISVYNGSPGKVHVIIDLFGIYDDGTIGGLQFKAITPTRIADTRSHFGATGPIGNAATAAFTAPSTVIDDNTAALDLNVTAIAPTKATYLTVWPTGTARPTASSLNPSPGQVVPNGVITGISSAAKFSIYNNLGTTNVAVDVDGLFEFDAFRNAALAHAANALTAAGGFHASSGGAGSARSAG